MSDYADTESAGQGAGSGHLHHQLANDWPTTPSEYYFLRLRLKAFIWPDFEFLSGFSLNTGVTHWSLCVLLTAHLQSL